MTTFGDEASDGMPARSHGTRLFHYDATCAQPAEGTGPALRTRPVGGCRTETGTRVSPAGNWSYSPGAPTGRPASPRSPGRVTRADRTTTSNGQRWWRTPPPAACPGSTRRTPGKLVGSVEMSAQVFGAARHPFGDAVRDPGTDPRLAVGAFLVLDRETRAVFDFFLADRQVFAVYERLPGDGGGDAFAYAVPVGERSPEQVHRLEVALDRARRRARWILDGRTVLTVDPVGAPLPCGPHTAPGSRPGAVGAGGRRAAATHLRPGHVDLAGRRGPRRSRPGAHERPTGLG